MQERSAEKCQRLPPNLSTPVISLCLSSELTKSIRGLDNMIPLRWRIHSFAIPVLELVSIGDIPKLRIAMYRNNNNRGANPLHN